MDTNAYIATVAATVSEAIEAAGQTTLSVALATNIPRTTLIRRLSAASPFTIAELHQIARFIEVDLDKLIVVPSEVPA